MSIHFTIFFIAVLAAVMAVIRKLGSSIWVCGYLKRHPRLNGHNFRKFFRSFHTLTFHALIVGFILVRLYNDTTFLDPSTYFQQLSIYPPWIKWILFLQIAHYVASTLELLLEKGNHYEEWRVLLLHHVVTVSFIFVGIYANMLHTSIIVVLLHDIADPLLEAAKLFNYMGLQLKDPMFALFMVVFSVTRLYYLPKWFVIPCVWGSACNPYPIVSSWLFIALQLIQVYWFGKALIIGWKICRGTYVEKD